MSTLRFRAWHLPSKTMETPSGENFLMVSSNGKIVLFEGEAIKESNDYVVMQSTGLKDKNGVEIFEGDILRRLDEAYLVEDMFPLHRHTHVTNVGFWYGGEYQFRDAAGAYDNNDDWMSWPEEYEVIGNRYESPSLLPL